MKGKSNPVARELNKLNRPKTVRMKTLYSRKGRAAKQFNKQ